MLGKTHWVQWFDEPMRLSKQIERALNAHIHSHHRKVLKEWKAKAALWCASNADVFRFLKNPLPTRSVTIEEGDLTHVHPENIESALVKY